MSSMKDAYLKQLRPMDGQQADTPTPPPAPAETDSAQQTLFPVVAPFDPYSGCSCGCFDHFLCRCDKPYPSGDEEIPF